MEPTIDIIATHPEAIRCHLLRLTNYAYANKTGPTKDIDDLIRKFTRRVIPMGPIGYATQLPEAIRPKTRVTLTYEEACLLHDAIEDDGPLSYEDAEWGASKRLQRRLLAWIDDLPKKPVHTQSVTYKVDRLALTKAALKGPLA